MIDLRSDTVTKPTDEMRKAMARADVGDDVYGEDPTVNRLQDMAGAMLGKRFCLFVPSGTMANQLAIRIQTQPGQEVIVESTSHIVRYEQGAAGALAGVQLHWVPGERGIITAEQVEAAIRPTDPHSITTALICLENTHNAGGGTIYPFQRSKNSHGCGAARHPDASGRRQTLQCRGRHDASADRVCSAL